VSSAVFASANGVKIADVDEHHRHLPAFTGEHVVALLEQPRRKHRIDVGAERPLKSLPLRQSGLHTVERCRERAEIVVLNHRQALAVVAGRNTFRSFGKILNWFQGRREGGEYRYRHTESQGQPESDHDPKRGI
jgi:hypothetical protein